MGSASNALPLLAPQMAAARHCLSLLLLSTCVALLLQSSLCASGTPLEPVYPGDNATPEQLAQYAAELRRYINMLTRPRCVPEGGGGVPAPAPPTFLGKQNLSTDQAWARVPLEDGTQGQAGGRWAGTWAQCLPAPAASPLPDMGKETRKKRR